MKLLFSHRSISHRIFYPLDPLTENIMTVMCLFCCLTSLVGRRISSSQELSKKNTRKRRRRVKVKGRKCHKRSHREMRVHSQSVVETGTTMKKILQSMKKCLDQRILFRGVEKKRQECEDTSEERRRQAKDPNLLVRNWLEIVRVSNFLYKDGKKEGPKEEATRLREDGEREERAKKGADEAKSSMPLASHSLQELEEENGKTGGREERHEQRNMRGKKGSEKMMCW